MSNNNNSNTNGAGVNQNKNLLSSQKSSQKQSEANEKPINRKNMDLLDKQKDLQGKQEQQEKHVDDEERHRQLINDNLKRRKDKQKKLKEMEQRLKQKETEIIDKQKKEKQDAYLKYLKSNSNAVAQKLKRDKEIEQYKNNVIYIRNTAYDQIYPSSSNANNSNLIKPKASQTHYDNDYGKKNLSQKDHSDNIPYVPKPIPIKDYYEQLQQQNLHNNRENQHQQVKDDNAEKVENKQLRIISEQIQEENTTTLNALDLDIKQSKQDLEKIKQIYEKAGQNAVKESFLVNFEQEWHDTESEDDNKQSQLLDSLLLEDKQRFNRPKISHQIQQQQQPTPKNQQQTQQIQQKQVKNLTGEKHKQTETEINNGAQSKQITEQNQDEAFPGFDNEGKMVVIPSVKISDDNDEIIIKDQKEKQQKQLINQKNTQKALVNSQQHSQDQQPNQQQQMTNNNSKSNYINIQDILQNKVIDHESMIEEVLDASSDKEDSAKNKVKKDQKEVKRPPVGKNEMQHDQPQQVQTFNDYVLSNDKVREARQLVKLEPVTKHQIGVIAKESSPNEQNSYYKNHYQSSSTNNKFNSKESSPKNGTIHTFKSQQSTIDRNQQSQQGSQYVEPKPKIGLNKNTNSDKPQSPNLQQQYSQYQTQQSQSEKQRNYSVPHATDKRAKSPLTLKNIQNPQILTNNQLQSQDQSEIDDTKGGSASKVIYPPCKPTYSRKAQERRSFLQQKKENEDISSLSDSQNNNSNESSLAVSKFKSKLQWNINKDKKLNQTKSENSEKEKESLHMEEFLKEKQLQQELVAFHLDNIEKVRDIECKNNIKIDLISSTQIQHKQSSQQSLNQNKQLIKINEVANEDELEESIQRLDQILAQQKGNNQKKKQFIQNQINSTLPPIMSLPQQQQQLLYYQQPAINQYANMNMIQQQYSFMQQQLINNQSFSNQYMQNPNQTHQIHQQQQLKQNEKEKQSSNQKVREQLGSTSSSKSSKISGANIPPSSSKSRQSRLNGQQAQSQSHQPQSNNISLPNQSINSMISQNPTLPQSQMVAASMAGIAIPGYSAPFNPIQLLATNQMLLNNSNQHPLSMQQQQQLLQQMPQMLNIAQQYGLIPQIPGQIIPGQLPLYSQILNGNPASQINGASGGPTIIQNQISPNIQVNLNQNNSINNQSRISNENNQNNISSNTSLMSLAGKMNIQSQTPNHLPRIQTGQSINQNSLQKQHQQQSTIQQNQPLQNNNENAQSLQKSIPKFSNSNDKILLNQQNPDALNQEQNQQYSPAFAKQNGSFKSQSDGQNNIQSNANNYNDFIHSNKNSFQQQQLQQSLQQVNKFNQVQQQQETGSPQNQEKSNMFIKKTSKKFDKMNNSQSFTSLSQNNVQQQNQSQQIQQQIHQQQIQQQNQQQITEEPSFSSNSILQDKNGNSQIGKTFQDQSNLIQNNQNTLKETIQQQSQQQSIVNQTETLDRTTESQMTGGGYGQMHKMKKDIQQNARSKSIKNKENLKKINEEEGEIKLADNANLRALLLDE